jgi:hypothetical protein
MRRETSARYLQPLLVVLLLMLSFASLALSPSDALAADESVCVWNPMSSSTSVMLRGVWGSSATDVFAVGDGGCIAHYDGVTWSPMSSGTTNPLFGVWGSSSSDVFVVGSLGTVLHYDGNTWISMNVTSEHLQCVWGSSSSDVFAVGQEVILHYDGGTWQTMMDLVTPSYFGPCHIWGSSPSDVFVVGQGDWGIWHYDGSAWLDIRSSITPLKNPPIWGIWGSSSSDVFVVGQGDILHFNGSSWGLMPSGLAFDGTLVAVWGSAWNDVFAVGWEGGTRRIILHYDGTAWTSTNTATGEGLRGVWCGPSSDVFAVGNKGTILHGAKAFLPQPQAVSTGSGSQGKTLDITITGNHFNGVDSVSLGEGITINSLTLNGDTEIVVNVTIEKGAAPGDRDVSIIAPWGTATLDNGFAVEEESFGDPAIWVAIGTGVALLACIAAFVLVQRRPANP